MPGQADSSTLFGPYAVAFSLLFALVLAELILATFAGQRFLGLSAMSVLRLGNVSFGLAGWMLIPLLWLGLVTVALVRRKAQRPTRALLRIVYARRKWLFRGLLLSVIHVPLGQAFAIFKSSIPRLNPFTFDARLAQFDRLIFGTDTWRLTHAVLGEAGTIAIDRAYLLWATYVVLVAGWISFTGDRNLQIKAALAFNLSWLIVGTILATTFASGGPCFAEHFHGTREFAPLMDELHATNDHTPLFAMQAMRYLMENYGTGRFGVGISAMPSMHVSVVTLGIVLAFAAAAPRWVKLLAIAFAAIIVVGSVHLGWHYAVDSMVAIPVTVTVWFGCSWLVEATRRDRKHFPLPPVSSQPSRQTGPTSLDAPNAC